MRLANLYKFAYVGLFLAPVSMCMCQYVLPYTERNTGVRAGPDFGWGVGFWNTHSSVELPIGLF